MCHVWRDIGAAQGHNRCRDMLSPGQRAKPVYWQLLLPRFRSSCVSGIGRRRDGDMRMEAKSAMPSSRTRERTDAVMAMSWRAPEIHGGLGQREIEVTGGRSAESREGKQGNNELRA